MTGKDVGVALRRVAGSWPVLTSCERTFLEAFSRNVDEHGQAFAKYATYARNADCSVWTIGRGVDALRRRKCIETERVRLPWSGSGRLRQAHLLITLVGELRTMVGLTTPPARATSDGGRPARAKALDAGQPARPGNIIALAASPSPLPARAKAETPGLPANPEHIIALAASREPRPASAEGEDEEKPLRGNDSNGPTSEVDDARASEKEADEALAAAALGNDDVPRPRDAESMFERIVAGGMDPRHAELLAFAFSDDLLGVSLADWRRERRRRDRGS